MLLLIYKQIVQPFIKAYIFISLYTYHIQRNKNNTMIIITNKQITYSYNLPSYCIYLKISVFINE